MSQVRAIQKPGEQDAKIEGGAFGGNPYVKAEARMSVDVFEGKDLG